MISVILLALGIVLTAVPGVMLANILAARPRPVAVFIFSSLVLFHALFWAGLAGVPLRPWPLAAVLLLATAAIFCAGRLAGVPAAVILRLPRLGFPRPPRSRAGRWAAALFAMAALLLLARGLCQPLNGWDTAFRWNFLALRILEHGNLGFYPPLTAAQFNEYFYPDAIPPLVSFTYFWLYSWWCAPAAWLTALPVLLQYLALGAVCWALAARLGGRRAAWLAMALLVASPLLFWAVQMGQETGLTALALMATLFFIASASGAGDLRAAALAGAAAAMGWLAREYGGIFLVCGLAACGWRRLGWRFCLVFAAAFFALGAPWYLRTWALTGNPFYSHSVAGLFPVNLTHAEIIRSYAGGYGFGAAAGESLGILGRIAIFTFPLQLFFGLAGGFFLWRRRGYLVAAVLLVAAVWLYSVSQTAGGLLYSCRVLSPALALLSVLAGVWIARLRKPVWRRGLALFSVLAAAAGLAANATMPRTLWKTPPAELVASGFRPPAPLPFADSAKQLAGALPPGIGILSDCAYFHAASAGAGWRVAPVWSPELRFLFEPGMDFVTAAKRLREFGIGAVLYWPASMNNPYLGQAAFFRELPERAAKFVPLGDGVILFLPE